MLDDARTEAARLIAADTICRNTVVVLIVGGGEGNTNGGANPATTASTFLNVGSRRVPIYVDRHCAALRRRGPAPGHRHQQRRQYFEVTKAMIDAAIASPKQPANLAPPTGTVVVPEMVNALNFAVQDAFEAFGTSTRRPPGRCRPGRRASFR